MNLTASSIALMHCRSFVLTHFRRFRMKRWFQSETNSFGPGFMRVGKFERKLTGRKRLFSRKRVKFILPMYVCNHVKGMVQSSAWIRAPRFLRSPCVIN